MKTLYALIFSFAFLSGCENIKFGIPDKVVETKVEEVKSTVIYTENLNKVVEEAKKLSKEDREYVFKKASGIYMYITYSNISSSDKVNVIIDRVQKDYSWTKNKNVTWNDAVSAFLVERGFDNPVKFESVEDRQKTASIFFDLADAIKKAE